MMTLQRILCVYGASNFVLLESYFLIDWTYRNYWICLDTFKVSSWQETSPNIPNAANIRHSHNVRWRHLLVRIESPIAITADPLFVFIIIGAFTTVISFQVGIHRLLRHPFISVRESLISRWFWFLPREHNNAYNLCLDTEFIIFDHFWNVSFGLVSCRTN